MTNVITNIEDMIKTEDVKDSVSTQKLEDKLNIIHSFLIAKSVANNSEEKINKYTEKNRNIRNGKTVIKGTRITTKELLSIMLENKSGQNVVEYIREQYPSIDSEEQIIYGALYEIRKMNTIAYIWKVWKNK